MLAERRKKVRYILNPTKKPLWTTDSNGIKFGKDLMEKMGWSAGKGLGANEQGIQEPLRVFSKNDTRGMGYKKNEENWIEYQDQFNFLLNQLASNADNNSNTKEAKKSEVQSLEEKSKLSKARVHYQKFTRGKDLSKYSENDLSCILGIGKMKKTKSETAEKETSYENNFCETSFGVTTINSGSSKDYFKKKWTANNLNFGNLSAQQFLSAEEEISEKSSSVLEKKSKKKDKEKRNEFLQIENGDEQIENKEIKLKKRMKLNLEEEIPRKRQKNSYKFDTEIQKGSENPVEIGNALENISDGCIKNIPKSKKKKKKKRECADSKEVEIKYQSEVLIDEKINNEKKRRESEEMSRSRYEEEVNGNAMEEEPQNETQKENFKETRKKEKKIEKLLKNDNNYEREVSEGAEAEKLKNISKVAPEKKTSSKKKLKLNAKFQIENKNNFEEQWEDQKSQMEDEIEEELVKKRKKKKKEIKNAEENGIELSKSELNIGKKKKKKKEKGSKSVEWSKEQISGDFLELELGNQMVEEKSVKKQKKCLEESKEAELATAAAAALNENKQKIYGETESQPEEVKKKKNGKKKEKGVECKVDQLQENILESKEKVSKEKGKNESEAHLDTSGVALGIRNEINNNEKENKNGKSDFTNETGETMIHTHKTALFYMKKPFLNKFKNSSTAKVLNLIFGAEIERFKGSNLGTLPGYGFKKIKKNVDG